MSTKKQSTEDINKGIDSLIETIKTHRMSFNRWHDIDETIRRLEYLKETIHLWGREYTKSQLKDITYQEIKKAINRDIKLKYLPCRISREDFCDLLTVDEATLKSISNGTYHILILPPREEELAGRDTEKYSWYLLAVCLIDAEGDIYTVDKYTWLKSVETTTRSERT